MRIIIRNYVLPKDQMTLNFDAAAAKISSIDVNTYMGEKKDAVVLQIQMATLPDGTNFAQRTCSDCQLKASVGGHQ